MKILATILAIVFNLRFLSIQRENRLTKLRESYSTEY